MSDDQIRYLSDSIRSLADKQEATTERMATVGATLARLETIMSALPDLQSRLRAVEEIAQQAKGAKWTLGALTTGAAFLGGGIGAKIVWLFTAAPK